MDPVSVGISGLANLAGAFVNSSSQRAINQQNIQFQEAANRTNQAMNEKQLEQQWKMFNENMQMQERFAQSGIRWRVQDAMEAGLHPLYALGGQPISYSPVSVGGGGMTPMGAPTLSADKSMGQALANMGQDVGRAINATRTTEERATAGAMATLGLERANLENDLLRAQIAKINASPNPAFPGTKSKTIPGQGDDPYIEVKPMEQTPTRAAGGEPGGNPDVGFAEGPDGAMYPVPGKNVKERIEDTLIPELMWAWRNQILPWFGENRTPPGQSPGRGRMWEYNRRTGGWERVETPFNRRWRGGNPEYERPSWRN